MFGEAAQDGDTLSGSDVGPLRVEDDSGASERRLGVTTDRMYRFICDVISGVLHRRNTLETVIVCATIRNRNGLLFYLFIYIRN